MIDQAQRQRPRRKPELSSMLNKGGHRKAERTETSKTNQPFKDYLKSITGDDCHHSIDHNFETWADDINTAARENECRLGRNGRKVFSHEISKNLTADLRPQVIDLEIRHYHAGNEISEEIYSYMLESGSNGLSSSEPCIQYWWEDTPVC